MSVVEIVLAVVCLLLWLGVGALHSRVIQLERAFVRAGLAAKRAAKGLDE